MEAISWTLIAILATLVFYCYLDYKKKCQYWRDKNVAFPKNRMSFVGTILSVFTKTPMSLRFKELHQAFPNEQFVGLYTLDAAPNLVIRDPAYLEQILVKDFQYFVDRDKKKEDKSTMMNLGLFALTGNEWRSYRAKISPTFTTGKLKNMFDELLPCGDVLVENLGKNGKTNHDIRDDIMTYAMDVSAAVIFGIELKNEELRSKYKKISTEIFSFTPWSALKILVILKSPRFANFIGLKFLKTEKEDFFKNIITQTFQQRMASGRQRNDYVQLLLKLKELGHLEVKNKDPDDNYLQSDEMIHTTEHFEVSDDILAAQAFQFLTAGFEPIYTTMSFVLYELAQHPEIQERVRQEVKEVKEKNGGYSYKTVRDMTYLEQCIQETLRKHPVVPMLMRYCVKDYTLNEHLTIDKGTMVVVSIDAIQNDPAYYPNPDKFDPERFNPDSPPKNYTYLPFGGGPRVCIGLRFAMMEMKFGLAQIIENYKFSLGDKNETPIPLSSTSFFLSPLSLYLNLEKI